MNKYEVHVSDLISFKSCRRKWDWSSPLRRGLEPERTPIQFLVGRAVHWALAQFYESGVKPSAAFNLFTERALRTEGALWMNESELLKQQLALGAAMCDNYVLWVNSIESPDKDWDVVATEVKYETPLFNPRGRLSNRIYLAGRFDQIIRNKHTGSLWLREFKTSKRSPDEEWLDFDDQCTSYCVPLRSEILTRTGWKTYNQLVVGEEALGYNLDGDCLEWTEVEAVRVYQDQPVITYSGKSFSFDCTKDHKWVQRRPEWSTFKDKILLEPIRPGLQQTYVVMSALLNSPTVNVTEDEAACLAWLLSDGSYGEYDRGLRASIAQKKYVEEIQGLLDRLGGNSVYSRIEKDHSGPGIFVWHLRVPFFRKLFSKAGLEMDLSGWENFVLGMSADARIAFCDAAMLAEGSNNKSFFQNPGVKHDLFKLAFFLCGSFPTKSKSSGGEGSNCEYFTVSEGRKWTRVIKISDQGIREGVWCPQTSLRTWVMRQDGQIVITGNCWAAGQIYGEPIRGVQYRFLMKRTPEEPNTLKNGSLSRAINSQLSTTYEVYLGALAKLAQRQAMQDTLKPIDDPATVAVTSIYFLALTDEYHDVLIELKGRGWGEYFIEIPINKTEHELEMQARELWSVGLEMVRKNIPIYAAPGWLKCQWCSFKTPCRLCNAGANYEQVLEHTYRVRQPELEIEEEEVEQ